MKKQSLLFLALILFTSFSFAQKKKGTQTSTTTTSSEVRSSKSSGMGFGKGDFVISGAFGFTSSEGNSSFKILPSAAYFLKDNLALIGTIGYEENAGSSSSTPGGSDDFIVAAGVRLFKNPASQFSLFAQGLLEFRSQSFGGNANGSSIGIAFSPGINYFVSNSFSIEATFGEIGFGSTSPPVGDSTSGFNFGIDMRDIGFGLNYKF